MKEPLFLDKINEHVWVDADNKGLVITKQGPKWESQEMILTPQEAEKLLDILKDREDIIRKIAKGKVDEPQELASFGHKTFNVGSSVVGIKKPHLGHNGVVTLFVSRLVYMVKWDDGVESHAYSHEIEALTDASCPKK